MRKKYVVGAFGCAALAAGVYAADHGDTPELISIARHDARVTDWFAWHTADTFFMITCTNANIPVGQTSYRFPEDLTVRFQIDNSSAVDFSNETANSKYGGRIVDPSKIAANITLDFSFDPNGNLVMYTEGLSAEAAARITKTSGFFDDPFINGRRNGRNVACIATSQPLADVKGAGNTLLTWTTSKVPDIHGPISEHSGRALRSQFPENNAMNTLRPRAHATELGLVPDVAIHNLAAPAGFPNGRLLTDDVIDLVGDPRLVNDPVAQAPTTNDKPFSATFPFLAAPH
jgi:hypothetical protein